MPENPTRAFDVRINPSRDGLLLVRGADVYELDEVGTLIWKACDGTRSVAEIAAHVRQHFEVGGEVALADTAAYVDQLSEAGLLEA